MNELNVKKETINKLGKHRSLGWGKFITKQELEKTTKSKINHFDYIKLKRFCTNKNSVTKIRRVTTNWEKTFIIKTSDKSLITQVYKELNQLYKKSSHPPTDKWARDMNRQFSYKDIKTFKKREKVFYISNN